MEASSVAYDMLVVINDALQWYLTCPLRVSLSGKPRKHTGQIHFSHFTVCVSVIALRSDKLVSKSRILRIICLCIARAFFCIFNILAKTPPSATEHFIGGMTQYNSYDTHNNHSRKDAPTWESIRHNWQQSHSFRHTKTLRGQIKSDLDWPVSNTPPVDEHNGREVQHIQYPRTLTGSINNICNLQK